MAAAFILIISISFIYTLYLQIFSIEQKHAMTFAKILSYGSIIGAVCLTASFILFYVRIIAIDNADLYGNIRDAFTVFAFPICFYSILVLVITTITYFVGKKTAAIIPSVCHLMSLLVLLWTIIFASWSHYDEIALNVYFNLLGSFLSLLVLLPAALEMKKLAKKLSDSQFVKQRIAKLGKNKTYAMERRRIKETKKRIKKGTKK